MRSATGSSLKFKSGRTLKVLAAACPTTTKGPEGPQVAQRPQLGNWGALSLGKRLSRVQLAVQTGEPFFKVFTEGTDDLTLRVPFLAQFLAPAHQLDTSLLKLKVRCFFRWTTRVFKVNHLRLPLSVDCV